MKFGLNFKLQNKYKLYLKYTLPYANLLHRLCLNICIIFYMCLIASVIILDYSHTCKNQSSIIILKYIKDISDKRSYFHLFINFSTHYQCFYGF